MEKIRDATVFMAVPTIYYAFLRRPEFKEKAKEFMAMLDDLETKAQKYTELTEDVYEIYTKFTNIQKTVENLIEQAEKLGKPTKVLKEVENRVSGIMRKMRKEYWGIGSGGE